MKFDKKNLFFSDNIIFFDTEFTNIDSEIGEIMSIGLVKSNGENLYLELEYDNGTIHPWVVDNVVPFLSGDKISKEKAPTVKCQLKNEPEIKDVVFIESEPLP